MRESARQQEVRRRLIAVMFTSDWPSDHAALEEFGGRLLDRHGDGIVATFDNCHNAVLALAAASEVIDLAAGLAFGEVAVEQGDGFGEAMVAAARLEALAPVGALLCTDMVRDHLGDPGTDPLSMVDHEMADLGPVELKGIGTVGHHQLDLIEHREALRGRSLSSRGDVALLSCDIVASTELLASEGTEAAIAVRRVFERSRTVACSAGTIVAVEGDGFVARFSSATDAARAAIELHQQVAEHGLRATGTAFSVRSGIAVGPDPMREAADLEASALPGQIVISKAAQALAFDLAYDVIDGSITPSIPERAPFPTDLTTRDELPLVGRAEPMADLDDGWRRVLAGESVTSFVTGEAGIGKTRLVSTFARSCHEAGAHVLFGASEMEMTAPYRPFAIALRALLDLDEGDTFLSRLRPLFPEAQPATARAGLTVESAVNDRTQLFEAVGDVLVALSDARPVLLVLDDLHWSSTATALLLGYLVRHPPPGRVMILGTFRDAEVDQSHPLFHVLSDQEVIGRTSRIRLENLNVAEVADLVGAHFATQVGDREHRLAERIHRESSGLPFFAGEVLRHVGSDVDLDDIERSRAGVLPASLIDAVRHRLGRLDDAASRMLEVAAIAGLTFELDVVAAALGVPRADLVAQLEAAERLTLVHESVGAGTYQFDHSLVRSALLGSLSATRTSMIHQQIAEALDSLPGDRNDALAHHWRQASSPSARQHAVRHLVLSAERDAASLAWEAAKARYDEAIDLAGDDQVVDTNLIVAMHLARAKAMRASGDPQYLDAMRETGRLARAAGLGDVIAQVAINSTKPGTWFANANEPDEHLIGLCEDALQWADLDPALRCRVLSTLATNLAFDADRERRRAIVDEAITLARSVGDADLIASALIASHLAFWDPSTLDERIEIIDELERLARRRDNPDHLFLAGFFRASLLIERGRISDARGELERLDEPIARTRNFWFRFLVDRMETALAVATCRPEAKMLVDKLFEESFETQADAAGTWGAQLGGLAIQAGTFGSMVDQLAAASERSRGQGVWSCGLAIAQLDSADADGARSTLDGLKDASPDFMWLVSQQMMAEAAYRLGDRARCRVVLDRLGPYAGRIGVIASGTLVFGLVSTSIGEAAMGAGELDLAIASLRSAVGQADEISLPFCQVRSRRRLLEALLADEGAGQERGAEQSASEEWIGESAKALELATTHGFASEVEALEALRTRRET